MQSAIDRIHLLRPNMNSGTINFRIRIQESSPARPPPLRPPTLPVRRGAQLGTATLRLYNPLLSDKSARLLPWPGHCSAIFSVCVCVSKVPFYCAPQPQLNLVCYGCEGRQNHSVAVNTKAAPQWGDKFSYQKKLY